MGHRRDERRQALAERMSAKEKEMLTPGGKSKYAKRKKARESGKPMAGRGHESRPWFSGFVGPALSRMPLPGAHDFSEPKASRAA